MNSFFVFFICRITEALDRQKLVTQFAGVRFTLFLRYGNDGSIIEDSDLNRSEYLSFARKADCPSFTSFFNSWERIKDISHALWFLEDAIDLDIANFPENSQRDDIIILIKARLDNSFLHCNPTRTTNDIYQASVIADDLLLKHWDRIAFDYGAVYPKEFHKIMIIAFIQYSPSYLRTFLSIIHLLDVLNQFRLREFLADAWVVATDSFGSSIGISSPLSVDQWYDALMVPPTRKGAALRIPMARDETVEVTEFWEEVLVGFTKGFTVPLRETALFEEDYKLRFPRDDELEKSRFRRIFMEIFGKNF